jgi:hypothetical protein
MTTTSPHPKESKRWVLVAGTGLVHGTPTEDVHAARAVGAELARSRYGLITGGWPGVDHVATEAFIEELLRAGLKLEDHLIQVVTEDRVVSHAAGRIVRTKPGPNEWLEPQKYADAVIVIGGRGGAYRAWLGALHDGLPRFPLGGTQGDATTAFQQTQEMWELIPVPGITLDQFNGLARRIDSPEAARAVADHLVHELLPRSLNAVDADSRQVGTAPSLFISYSRRDRDWVNRIRTLLRPAERRGVLLAWVDSDIEQGVPWETQIEAMLKSARAALLLVSPAFLASRYVREIELPAFAKRMKAGDFHLFWLLLEDCDWQAVPELRDIQALGDVNTSIDACATRSDEQCRLIDAVETITRQLGTHPS